MPKKFIKLCFTKSFIWLHHWTRNHLFCVASLRGKLVWFLMNLNKIFYMLWITKSLFVEWNIKEKHVLIRCYMKRCYIISFRIMKLNAIKRATFMDVRVWNFQRNKPFYDYQKNLTLSVFVFCLNKL